MLRSMITRNTLGRLVVWMAEALDRSLLTVPDFDVDEGQMIHGWVARTCYGY